MMNLLNHIHYVAWLYKKILSEMKSVLALSSVDKIWSCLIFSEVLPVLASQPDFWM